MLKRYADIRMRPGYVTPIGLALLSFFVSIGATLVPPGFYSLVVGEDNLMFFNWELYLFISLCTLFFILGFFVASRPSRPATTANRLASSSFRTEHTERFIIFLSLFAIVLSLSASISFFLNSPGLILSLFSRQGQDIKAASIVDALEGNSDVSLDSVKILAVPALYLAIRLRSILGGYNAPKQNGLFSSTFWIYAGVISFIISSVSLLGRGDLIAFLAGCIVLWVSTPGTRKLGKRMLQILLVSAAIIVFFLIISYLRSSADSALYFLLGYGPGSFNRLAAVLEGSISAPTTVPFYYSLTGLIYPPLVRRVFDPASWLGLRGEIPESWSADWLEQFSAVAGSGLTPAFIWPTAYGYAYYDFGWLSPLYFAVLGIVLALLFRSFKKGGLFAASFYPAAASTILLWGTYNIIALPSTIAIAEGSVVFAILYRGTAILSIRRRPYLSIPR